MFVIEDELHADIHGQFTEYQLAIEELKRRTMILWDQHPNRAPCRSWQTCGREYEVVEFDDSHVPWKELSRIATLEVSASGWRWLIDVEEADSKT